MRHDIQYEMYQDRRQRLDADKAMINELINIEKPTCRERIERFFVLPIMVVKRCITACLLRIPIINR
jgi:Phospholipase A2-like domain